MKKLLFLFGFCLLMQFANAQTDTTKKEEENVFVSVQEEAKFPGGIAAWRRYLERTLNHSLLDSCTKKDDRLNLTIVVSFRVDKEGSVSEVHVDNARKFCPFLVAEAIRVIQQGPRWIPAMQNGRKVVSLHKQSIIIEPGED